MTFDAFKQWLNENRDANVSEIFHDILTNFEALMSLPQARTTLAAPAALAAAPKE